MTAGDVIVISESGSGKKANFYDGVDDYMLADAHAVARVAANDTFGTYTAWIWADNIASGDQTILSAGDNNAVTEYLFFALTSTGELRVVLRHGGADKLDITQTTATMTSKTWHHVAITQNGTRPTLYVDGEAVAMTDTTAVDLTYWYDELTQVDKFAIGVLEQNSTHLFDFKGAIGKVKYWSLALTESEIKNTMHERTESTDTVRQTALNAALQFNITMENDGTTDSGLGLDNGTLTGNAHYGAKISTHSWFVEKNSTGHAAEFINTFIDGNKYVSLIKRGD